MGAEFRLVAITRTVRGSTSWDIASYDAFVQADLGSTSAHPDIRQYADQFRVLGSTASVDARDHIGANLEDGPGVPMYWLNGAKIAKDYRAFFWEQWDSYVGRKSNGDRFPRLESLIATGTRRGGSAADGKMLGTTTGSYHGLIVSIGTLSAGSGIEFSTVRTNHELPFYAVSPVFRVMDDGIPYVAGLEVASDAGADGSYQQGETIRIKATFNEAVQVEGRPFLRLRLGMDGAASSPSNRKVVNARYSAGHSTSTELAFDYTVSPSDRDNDGVSVAYNALRLDGGNITNQSGSVKANLYNPYLPNRPEHRVNLTAYVDQLSVLSSPRASSDEYGLGETIEFAVTFSEPVIVDTVGGQPTLAIQIGTSKVQADYRRTAGSAVVFAHTVASRQLDVDGVRIKTNSLSLGGATIRSASTGSNADLAFKSRDFREHMVDAGLTPPLSDDASLSGLVFSGVSLLGDFSPDATNYVGTAPNAVAETTIHAMPADAAADVNYSVSDSNDLETGTQASLVVGSNTITVTVGATDGNTTKAYTIEIVRRMAGELPDVSIAADAASVTEGTQAAFTLTRSGPHTNALTVAVDVTQTGSAIATENGYQAPTEVAFAAGAETATLAVSTKADTTDEPDGTITAVLAPQATHTSDASSSAQATVEDDDDTPRATLVLTPASISENGGTATVTATLDRPSSEDTVLAVSATPVAPTEARDFTLSPDMELSVPAGETTSVGTVTMTAVDNSLGAASKTVTVSATAENAHGMGSPDSATLTITDDDSGPVAPMNLVATAGNTQVVLSWDAPADGSEVTGHEYRYRSEDAKYPSTWDSIADSAEGEANEDGGTVTGLTNAQTYWFQVRAVSNDDASEASMSASATSGAGLGICDRTEQVKEAILDLITGISDCANVTSEHLANITGKLRLAHTGIHEVKPGDFGGLTSITRLLLYSDHVTSFPDGIFSDLASLTELNLRFNKIDTLSAGVFTGLTSLRELHLQGNKLKSLPDSVFSGLTELRVLDLYRNGLTAISDRTFDGLTNLTELQLKDNKLRELPAGGFSDLSSLTKLNLSDNFIPTLRSDMFTGLDAITELYIEANTLSRTTVHTPYSELETLEVLSMNFSQFRNTFGLGMFVHLTSLKSFQAMPDIVPEDPYRLYVGVELELVDEGIFRVISQNGAPFNMEIPLEIENGSLGNGATSVTMAVGTDKTDDFSVLRTSGSTGPVIVRIVNQGGFIDGIALPAGDPENGIPPHAGYSIAVTRSMGELEVIPAFPQIDLSLSSAAILEQDDSGTSEVNEALTNVTATLAEPVDTAFTIDVSVTPIGSATASDYTLSENTTLSFAANATTSTGTVTISAVDNDAASADRYYTVSATAASPAVAHGPKSVTLAIYDDDPSPAPSGLSVAAGDRAITLTWDAPATTDGIHGYEYRYKLRSDSDYPDTWTEVASRYPGFSDGPAPIVPLHPMPPDPDEEQPIPDGYTVGGLTNGEKYAFQVRAVNRVGTSGVAATSGTAEPAAPPTVTLVLTPAAISETQDPLVPSVSTVTATLSIEVEAPFSITVMATGSGRYAFSANRVLQFPADSLTSTGVVTITAVDNGISDADETIRVSATVSSAGRAANVRGPSGITLTIVDPENMAPTSRDVTVRIDEDTSYAFAASDFPFSDGEAEDTLQSIGILKLPQAGNLKFGDVALTDGYKVEVSDIDELSFEPAPNGYGEDYASFTFTVSDGEGSSATPSTMTFTVTAVNDPPVFEGAAALSAMEGQTSAGDVRADDVDGGDAVAYAITGGADSADFAIDARTGQLTFTSAPDFDNPTDRASTTPANVAGNNEYVVEVTATGGGGDRALTAEQTFIVTVTEMAETTAGDREITSVSITSTPGSDNLYGIDDVVAVNVTFNDAVSVMPTPRLDIGLSSTTAGDTIPTVGSACYASGSGSASLVFRYAVRQGQHGQLVVQALVADDSTHAGTGTIYSGTADNLANLAFTPTSANAAQAVDGVRPVLSSSSLSADRDQIILVFSESLSGTTAPSSAFAVTVDGEAADLSSVTASGTELTVTLDSAVGSGERVELSYSEPTAIDVTPPSDGVCGLDFAGNDANAVQDVAGNDARSFDTVVDRGTSLLVATFMDMPAEHDEASFSFRISFSEAIATSYKWVRDSAMTVTGGSVTAVHRIQGRSDLWNVTIDPSGRGDVTVTLKVADSCGNVSKNVCTSDKRGLSAEVTASVSGPPGTPAPLTAEFQDVPGEHDGANVFSVRIQFNVPISISFLRMQTSAVTVSGGRATAARRVDGQNDLWEIDIDPYPYKDVSISLAATEGCGSTEAICTSDARPLTNSPSTTVRSRPQPWLTINDPYVDEGEILTFTVTLSHAAPMTVTVDYDTDDGKATQGLDYTATSGTLTFAEGELTKTISVNVLTDSLDEPAEAFLLILTNVSGALLRDDEGIGHIRDTN